MTTYLNWGSTQEMAMMNLMDTFPTLSRWLERRTELTRPPMGWWSPSELDRAASSGLHGSGFLHAARFVLHVWDPRRHWECGGFNLADAFAYWDSDHRKAFAAWAQKPFWA